MQTVKEALVEKQCTKKTDFPTGDFINILATIALCLFTDYDTLLTIIVAIETFCLGFRFGEDREYFKRYCFWRKS